MDRTEAQAQKTENSRDCPPRAKPIPRCLVRTDWRVQLTLRGRIEDGGFMLTMEAGRKLSPERFFRLVVVVLRAK